MLHIFHFIEGYDQIGKNDYLGLQGGLEVYNLEDIGNSTPRTIHTHRSTHTFELPEHGLNQDLWQTYMFSESAVS